MGVIKKVAKCIFDNIVVVLISIGIGLLVRNYVFGLAHVDGVSMAPTFHNTQLVLIDKISPIFTDYKYGDIVVFDSHDEQNNKYVKRVIALPNDHIVIKNDKVYVNDKQIVENYLVEGTPTEGKIDLVVPKNQYFVLGDNRMNSKDSRFIGPIEREDMTGRVANH